MFKQIFIPQWGEGHGVGAPRIYHCQPLSASVLHFTFAHIHVGLHMRPGGNHAATAGHM